MLYVQDYNTFYQNNLIKDNACIVFNVLLLDNIIGFIYIVPKI